MAKGQLRERRGVTTVTTVTTGFAKVLSKSSRVRHKRLVTVVTVVTAFKINGLLSPLWWSVTSMKW